MAEKTSLSSSTSNVGWKSQSVSETADVSPKPKPDPIKPQSQNINNYEERHIIQLQGGSSGDEETDRLERFKVRSIQAGGGKAGGSNTGGTGAGTGTGGTHIEPVATSITKRFFTWLFG